MFKVRSFSGGVVVECLPANAETQVQSLVQEDLTCQKKKLKKKDLTCPEAAKPESHTTEVHKPTARTPRQKKTLQ